MKPLAAPIVASVAWLVSAFSVSEARAAECVINGPVLAPASCEITCDQSETTVSQLGVGVGICLAHPDGGCELQCSNPYFGLGPCLAHATQELAGTRICYVFPFELTTEQDLEISAGVVVQALCRC